jgi:hypothetical protein
LTSSGNSCRTVKSAWLRELGMKSSRVTLFVSPNSQALEHDALAAWTSWSIVTCGSK